MQVVILPIPYTAAVDDTWWVRFAQPELVDDTATVSETADLLDALYSIDPCDAFEFDPDEPTAEDVEAAVVQTYSLAICSQDTDGSATLEVRLYRSHQDTPYTLRVSGGRVIGAPVVTPEEVATILTVKQQSSLTLEYPVVEGFTAEWIGTVSGADAAPVDGPPIHRAGNTLHWPGRVTGTLRVTFVSVFDALSILVDGINGEMGQATVRVFYHGDCTVFVPEMPKPAEVDGSLCPSTSWTVDPDSDHVTCYQVVEQHKLDSCTKEQVGGGETFEREVPCPEWAPSRCPGDVTDCRHLLGTVAEEFYVDGDQATGDAVADREYYKEQCCTYPSATLPRCKEKIETYTGGKPIEHGEAFWRGLYGPHTRFVPVSPENGCGKHITRQIVEAESCCDTIPPLTWDAASSIDTLQANDDGYVYVLDGLGPFSWRIISTRGYVWFRDSGTGTLVTDEATRWAALVSGDYPCGTYTIEVTDACGTTVSGEVAANNGTWTLLMSPSSKSDWTVDEFEGALYSLPVSAALIQSSTIIADESNQKLLSVVIKGATKTYKVEQYIGVIWWHLWDTSDNTMIMPCFPTAHEIVPSDFPFPTAIPTTVWPAEPLTYDGGNGSGIAPGHPYYVPDSVLHYNGTYYDGACIWTNKPSWSDYSPLTRRVVKELSAIEFLTADSNLPTTDFYSQIPDEPEMLWAYTRTFGGDGYYDCCSAGEYCYEEYFGFLIYGQTLRVYGYNC